mmetsp:Transcript_2289/g.2764  ORF Transcript_2289/g.2764 Transcript_2289/m.2764 type:complete len:225 (+) Transcript_2289:121-795(+)
MPRTPKRSHAPLLDQGTSLKFEYSDDLESFSIHRSPMVPLMDIDSTLEISRDVADGYLILLSGGLNSARAIRQQRKKKKVSSAPPPPPDGELSAQSMETLSPEELSAVQLAFAALTDGNAIDIMFGVKSMGGIRRSQETSEKAYKSANDAKQAIMEAAHTSDALRLLAVETYVKSFEIIVKYHMDLDKMGFITYCVKHQKIREGTEKQLIETFRALDEAVAASS